MHLFWFSCFLKFPLFAPFQIGRIHIKDAKDFRIPNVWCGRWSHRFIIVYEVTCKSCMCPNVMSVLWSLVIVWQNGNIMCLLALQNKVQFNNMLVVLKKPNNILNSHLWFTEYHISNMKHATKLTDLPVINDFMYVMHVYVYKEINFHLYTRNIRVHFLYTCAPHFTVFFLEILFLRLSVRYPVVCLERVQRKLRTC